MRLLVYLVLFSSFFSCQNPPAESRADRIAKGICDCSTQLLNLNKQAANANGNIDFEGIQAEFEKTKACIVNQRMKPEDRSDVKNALALKCPELAKETELLAELLGIAEF